MEKEEKQSKLIGYIGTAVVHVIIFILLWVLILTKPDPPLDAGGMGLSMSLGEEDMGGPSPDPVVDPAPQDPIPPTEQTEQIVTTEDETEENPVTVKQNNTEVKKPETKQPVTKPVETPPVKPVERRPEERALFKKRTNTSSEASGSGSGTAPGNEGRPDGDPNGSPNGNGYGTGGNGSGTGTGDGIGSGKGPGFGFELGGRTVARRPEIVDNSRETGKVVVNIVVDRNGKVIKATPGGKGTTTLNNALLEKARQGALETRFSAKPDGPEEQYGTITIIFRFKQ